MKLYETNPCLRFASKTHHISHHSPVKVTDCRIFYIVGGQGNLTIANQRYQLYTNVLVYCCAGSEYIIEAPEGLDLIAINFDLTQNHRQEQIPYPPCKTQRNWDTLPVYFEPVDDSPILGSHFYLPNGSDLFPIIEKLLTEFSGSSMFNGEYCSCIIKELLIALHRATQPTIPAKIELVKTYIDQNFAKDINNKELAALVGYHDYYLNRIFTAYIGTNLHNYLLKTRLNHASYLILNTDLPLKSIPELVGFNSYPHFSSYFKQNFGYAPAEYRKRLKSNI